jgi:hypothetical protein
MFLANALYALLALVAIPILAHLFSRTRPRRRPFPSLKLLREALRQVTRVRQPRDRWLLILRTLAMLALIAAFLQPWLLSRFSLGGNAARTTVLVVDVSASMAYADGTRTRLAQAASAAEEVLSTLPANSRASVIWLRGHAASALPEPGSNLDYLRQALRQAAAQPEPGDIAGAMALARQQLAAVDTGAREVVVISDFQKAAWQNANLDVPSGVKLTRIAVGQEDAANVALAGLALEPPRPVAGQEARLVCRVRNFSAEPRRVTVFAEAGESRLSQVVEVAAWSETLAVMPAKFPAEGIVPLKASITEDRFPGDDVRYGIADVRGALQVAVVGSEEDATARAWARAAQALESVAVRRIAPAQLASPVRTDVLFVAGWNGQPAPALTALIERGGALVVQPAEGFDPTAARTALGLPAAASVETPLGVEVKDTPGWALRIADEEHPAVALFATGLYGDPVKASFRRRVVTPAFLTARPLLTFEDGRPGLTFFDTGPDRRAIVAWWNLDLGATDWPTRGAFVSFFGEFLRHLSSRLAAPVTRGVEPGELLRHEMAPALDPAGLRLVDERDQVLPIAAESSRTPSRLASAAPAGPGSYRWMAQGGVLDRAFVNFPDTESDLRRLSAEELQQSGGTLIASGARAGIAGLREGRPLWAWCLAIAALVLLIEGWCAWKFPTRTVASAPPGTSPAPPPPSPKPREETVAV